jgi:peptidoglycan glycosyltransferase
VNATIRRVGTAMLALFLALAGQLTYLQLVRATDLEEDPRNVRIFLRDLNRPRGAIVSSDGAVLAQSVPSTGDGDDLDLQRVYPPETAALFAHVVGYQSVNFGNTGVEATYNDELVGRDRVPRSAGDVVDLFSPEDLTGNVVLTVSKRAQETAAAALAQRRGSVVVLDVATGGIVAAYSNPSYDPNLLASHDVDVASAAFQLLTADDGNPMLARVWREVYPPGSTFKVVTAGIALEHGGVTLETPVYPTIDELALPLTVETLENFGGHTCGGNLFVSFRDSCNTTFGRIGLDLGETFAEHLPDFGVNADPPPADLRPRVVGSTGPEPGSFERNAPLFAQAAIGQGQIAVTPLEMAMLAQAVANDGVMLVPHVLDRVETVDGEVVPGSRFDRRTYKRAMSLATARTLRDLMVEVVNDGTGTAAQLPGIQVAGKTGTAQVAGNDAPHAWFVAFAPADNPVYAVAVLVEHGGDLGSEATGGRVAAPVAAQVLQALLQP